MKIKATFANRTDKPKIVEAALNRVKRDGLPLVPSFDFLKMFRSSEKDFVNAGRCYRVNNNR